MRRRRSVLGMFLVAIWVLTGSPRSAAGEQAAAAAVTPVQILDSYLLRVPPPVGTSFNREVVPLPTILEYCGDGDGCRIRLFRSNPGATLDEVQLSFLFSVSADGNLWKSRWFDSAPIAEGNRTNLVNEAIIVIGNPIEGIDICSFRDGSSGEFEVLNDSRFAATEVDCTLKIED